VEWCAVAEESDGPDREELFHTFTRQGLNVDSTT
jgi:hypothetical protein